eukprot:680421-Rhodomonas_salina.1
MRIHAHKIPRVDRFSQFASKLLMQLMKRPQAARSSGVLRCRPQSPHPISSLSSPVSHHARHSQALNMSGQRAGPVVRRQQSASLLTAAPLCCCCFRFIVHLSCSCSRRQEDLAGSEFLPGLCHGIGSEKFCMTGAFNLLH